MKDFRKKKLYVFVDVLCVVVGKYSSYSVSISHCA